jgi:hypothetical protein
MTEIDTTTTIITRTADDGKHNNSNNKKGRIINVLVRQCRRRYLIIALSIYLLVSNIFLSDHHITRLSTLYTNSNNDIPSTRLIM